MDADIAARESPMDRLSPFRVCGMKVRVLDVKLFKYQEPFDWFCCAISVLEPAWSLGNGFSFFGRFFIVLECFSNQC